MSHDSRSRFHRSPRPNRSRDYDSPDRLRRKREWEEQMIREEEHEIRKQMMIRKWELKKEKENELNRSRQKSLPSKRSRDRSLERRTKHRTLSESRRSKSPKSQTEKESVFEGPEGIKVDISELRRIKVDIYRNIPGPRVPEEIKRDIIHPEDVVLKRREGEGSKPIFERPELKKPQDKIDAVEERRTVCAVDSDKRVKQSSSLKRLRSRSLDCPRTGKTGKDSSPLPSTSQQTRREDDKQRRTHKDNREKGHTRDHGERHKDEEVKKGDKRRSSRDRSTSRERSYRSSREERSYQERREKSRERSQTRREKDRTRPSPLPHYIEPVPVFYYGPMGQVIPMRAPMRPPIVPMGPMGPPFHPRPRMMYAPRLGPPNQRFRPIF